MATHHRVIIVGGGVAGVAASAALRAGAYDGDIVLLDEAEFPYDRPPLSKEYLAGTRDLEQIELQQREWYGEQRIELVGPARMDALTLGKDSLEVTLADGRSYGADWVVLAMGGRAAVPPIPGMEEGRSAGKVHVLREAQDADRLRAALTEGARLLVVGGGLIGAEVASTARSLGCEVVLVDPLNPPLAAAVGNDLATWLHAEHARFGIETLDAVLEAVQLRGDGIAAQLRGESDARQFDAILVGVGMVPNTELAVAAGLDVDRGILVDERQVTSHPRVLAAGDCARRRDHQRTEHWEVAQLDGQRAAASILNAPQPAPTASWWWSDRHHRHVEGVGQMRESDSQTTVVTRGTFGDAPFAVFVLRDGCVIGAVAVDDSHAARAARRLIDRAVRVDAGRLGDPTTDLRKLLRG